MRDSKKMFFLIFLGLLIIPFVSATDVSTVQPGDLSEVNLTFLTGGVLQNTVSTTPDATDCTGDWHVSHLCSYTYDEDWDTYGHANDMDGDVYVYHNYTIPSLAGDNVTWEIKYDSPATTVNYTIPDSCLTGSTLELRYFGLWSSGSGNSYGTYYCKNSSDWEIVYDGGSNPESGDFYEGQVYWDLQNYFFQIPNTETVNSATMNVTGYTEEEELDEELSYSCESGISSCSSGFDENWGTDAYYANTVGGTQSRLAYENISSFDNTVSANVTFKFQRCNDYHLHCKNQSSSSWIEVYDGGYSTSAQTITQDLPSDCLIGDTLELRHNLTHTYGGYMCSLYETKTNSIIPPQNSSIYIDSSKIWNYSLGFNTEETTSDFASVLNSELSSCSTSTCNISLDLFSDTSGSLGLFDFDIEYNDAPYSTPNYPTDGATGIPFNVTLNASVFDGNGDTLNGTLYLILDEETSSSWTDQGCSLGSDSEANAVDEDWDTYAAGGTIYENISLDEDTTNPYWKYKVASFSPSPFEIDCYNGSEWLTMVSTVSSGTFYAPINATCYDQEILQLRTNATLSGAACEVGGGTSYYKRYYEGQLVRNSSYPSLSNGSIVNETFILKGPRTYLWYLNLTDGFESNYSIWNFTIESIPLDNGSIYSNPLITLFLKDEETQELINGSISLVINTDGTNYTFSETDVSNLSVYGPEGSITIDEAFIEYRSTGYSVENYYIYDSEWSTDSPIEINLYDVNSSIDTVFEVSVLDTSYAGLDNAYVKLLRYYPADNQYLLTEVGKTDSDGKTLLHIVLEDVFYTLLVEKDGEILSSSDPSKKYCSETPCTLTINTASEAGSIWSSILGVENFAYNVTYNDTTSKVRMVYSDTSGTLSYVRMLVRLPDFLVDEVDICDVNSSSASGVLFCNLTDTFMENVTGTFFVDVFVSRSPEEEDADSVALTFTKFLRADGIFDTFSPGTIGSEGLVWGIFIIISLVTLGVFNPKLAIILACVALGFVGFIGIVKMSFGAIMGIVAVGVLIIVFIKRGEPQ